MLKLRQNLASIDSVSTRDIDDAISVEKTPDGWQALVAIAAPGVSVSMGSDADIAARAMAATVYARTSVVKSMLPREISEGAATLKAGSTRPAMLIEIRLNDELDVLETNISLSDVIVSDKLSYEDVPIYARKPTDIGRMLQNAIYCLQTSSTVEQLSKEFSIHQQLLPRNLFPRLKLPLVFARFVKERHRQLFGFLLCRLARHPRRLAPSCSRRAGHVGW
jgi:exoribonuclease II